MLSASPSLLNSPSSATPRRPLVTASPATPYRRKPNNLYVRPKGMAATSLYEILGIPMGATNQEIKSAYRRLARTCHPDVAEIDRKDTSADEFMRIHAAYSTLSDPEKRAVYDGKLFRLNRPLTAGFSGYGGRNWETDQCW